MNTDQKEYTYSHPELMDRLPNLGLICCYGRVKNESTWLPPSEEGSRWPTARSWTPVRVNRLRRYNGQL